MAASRPVARPVIVVVGIWLAWALALLGFQELVVGRFEPERPDRVLGWTARHTTDDRMETRPYLADPTLNTHVSFDSEYYLSIAVRGYDDERVTAYEPPAGDPIPANYLFLPAYPHVVRAVAAPMTWLGVGSIAAATIAGVVVSLLGALAATLALHRLARPHLGESGARRAAFYLLVFPSGFFLAQVYTEGLFLGLAFWSLTLATERRPLQAAILAVGAVLTRAVGIALVIPLAVGLIQAVRRHAAATGGLRNAVIEVGVWVVATITPVATYLAWASSPLGEHFDTLQEELGARATLNFEVAAAAWTRVFAEWGERLPATRVYYLLEVGALVLAVVACLWAIRRWPGPALFGLAAVVIAVTSGPAQGMIRYVLAAPAIFLFLGALGRNPAIDRGWTVVSVLLMGLLVTLFSFDFWVA